ncbi:MAG TPA: hypothetical protein VMI30_05100, partial [Stellaceae bacterium]|nr:hypothetical protein [Stellaceae bacterium]
MKRRFVGVAVVVLGLFISDVDTARATDSRSHSLSDGGRTRTYLLYRPSSVDYQAPAPLVIMLHGGFGSGRQA